MTLTETDAAEREDGSIVIINNTSIINISLEVSFSQYLALHGMNVSLGTSDVTHGEVTAGTFV